MGKLHVNITHGSVGGGADVIIQFLIGFGALMVALALVAPAMAAVGIIGLALAFLIKVAAISIAVIAGIVAIVFGYKLWTEIHTSKSEKEMMKEWTNYSRKQNDKYFDYKQKQLEESNENLNPTMNVGEAIRLDRQA